MGKSKNIIDRLEERALLLFLLLLVSSPTSNASDANDAIGVGLDERGIIGNVGGGGGGGGGAEDGGGE